MRLLLLALLALVACAHAALVSPLFSWPVDGGRLGVRLYHGNEERATLTRLAFEAPQTAIFASANNTGMLSVLPHTALALRDDETSRPSVSDAATARMSRTRISSRGTAQIMAVDLVDDTAKLLGDWTIVSRWRAALFLDAHSDVWREYACWSLDNIGGAAPLLAVETRAECDTRIAIPHTTWNVQPYAYSLPRDATARKHGRRAGVLLLGMARLAEPVPVCGSLRCNVSIQHTEAAYPLVLDLESKRNYLPAAMHFMCIANRTLWLSFEFLDSTEREGARLPCSLDYAINTDSQEVVLGMAFVLRNFSRITYDAKKLHVHVQFAVPVITEALRGVVSLLAVMLNTLSMLWIDVRSNYATMVAIVAALGAPQGASVLPFAAPHAVFELVALALSSLVVGLTVPHVDPEFGVYYWIILSIWAVYAILTLVLLIVTAPTVVPRLRNWGRSYLVIAASSDFVPTPPTVVMLSATVVFARHCSAMMLIGTGTLLALLLSSDSLLMLAVAAFIAALSAYHLAYYASAALICSGGLHGRARAVFSGAAWGTFTLLVSVTALVLTAATHILLTTVVLQDANSFYPSVLLSLLCALVLSAALGLGIYQASNDVFTAKWE